MSDASALLDADMKRLMGDLSALRFFYRVLDASGYLKGAYGADGRNLVYNEGRRSLGLEVLQLVEATQPDALIRILQAAQTIPKEIPHGRRSNSTNRTDEDADG